jgi:hypothetical protein
VKDELAEDSGAKVRVCPTKTRQPPRQEKKKQEKWALSPVVLG